MPLPFRLAPSWLLGFAIGAGTAGAGAQTLPPNIIIISCDDLGYGDLGVQGHPTIRTPAIDKMAAEGQRWKNFYVAASVCTPSRAALMTGRLPIRSGMYGDTIRVLLPTSERGLPQTEWTMAEALRGAGYATACIGKWHLGHRREYLPHRHGFDTFFGLPYSNDMAATIPITMNEYLAPQSSYWNVPLMRDDVVLEQPVDQQTITERYTTQSIRFINSHQNQPFFLYLAHTMPHVPLFPSQQFAGRSDRGPYGDVVEEIDAGVGRILDTLGTLNIADRTLVIFTSDNGPWLSFGALGGSTAFLRGGKGDTFEGGMRVPAIFWWPNTIQPSVVPGIGSTLDLLPSLCTLIGMEPPEGLEFDGIDLTGAWLGINESPRQTMFFYRGSQLFAVRNGHFKAHFKTQSGYGNDPVLSHNPPLLFHLGHDPAEQYELAANNPEALADIQAVLANHIANRVIAPSHLDY